MKQEARKRNLSQQQQLHRDVTTIISALNSSSTSPHSKSYKPNENAPYAHAPFTSHIHIIILIMEIHTYPSPSLHLDSLKLGHTHISRAQKL